MLEESAEEEKGAQEEELLGFDAGKQLRDQQFQASKNYNK